MTAGGEKSRRCRATKRLCWSSRRDFNGASPDYDSGRSRYEASITTLHRSEL